MLGPGKTIVTCLCDSGQVSIRYKLFCMYTVITDLCCLSLGAALHDVNAIRYLITSFQPYVHEHLSCTQSGSLPCWWLLSMHLLPLLLLQCFSVLLYCPTVHIKFILSLYLLVLVSCGLHCILLFYLLLGICLYWHLPLHALLAYLNILNVTIQRLSCFPSHSRTSSSHSSYLSSTCLHCTVSFVRYWSIWHLPYYY